MVTGDVVSPVVGGTMRVLRLRWVVALGCRVRLGRRAGKPGEERDEIGVLVRRMFGSLSLVDEQGDVHGLVVRVPARRRVR